MTEVSSFLYSLATAAVFRQGRTNTIAENFLKTEKEVRLDNGRLTPWIKQSEDSLEEAIKRACKVESYAQCPDRMEMTLPRQNLIQPPRILDVIPLFGSRMISTTGFECLVLAIDPSASAHVSPDLIQRMWKLTPTEANLAIALSNGCSTNDFADPYSISVGTARWHLKNLQSKLGVNSIASLVLLVKGSALSA